MDQRRMEAFSDGVIAAYYDQLAPYYKYLLQDWEASVSRQAAVLDGVIGEFFGPRARRLLDAACGIGTQSLGLAQLGYTVTASDISALAVEQARAEAARRGLSIAFGMADMRRLVQAYPQPFDVVLAGDNAIPHLLSDAEILLAFEQFYRCTQPAGGCILSVRDYAQMDERRGQKLHPRTTHLTPTGRIVVFDLWEFDGDFYDFTTYVVDDQNAATATTHVIRGGRYYCVTVATLEKLLRQAGFQRVVTLTDRFYQPLLVGLKA
jgi:SAM-dependent methyltransferase